MPFAAIRTPTSASRRLPVLRPLAWLATVLLPAAAGAASLVPDPPPAQQRGGTFTEPPREVDPAFLPLGPDRPAPRGGGPALSLRITLDLPLRIHGGGNVGAGSQGAQAKAHTLQAQVRWQPFDDRRWFVQASAWSYLAGTRQPWNPDFIYSFGFEDFRPGSLSLTYANYTGTRFKPDGPGEGRFNFSQGQWSLVGRFGLPEALKPLLLVGDGDDATCSAGGHLTPRYADATGGALKQNKTLLSLGCRYSRPGGFFAHFTAFAWPDRIRRQPWDPDFTYGFGIAASEHWPFTMQYSNYSGNRFPGRPHAPGEGDFRSGSISITWGRDW